MSHKYRGQRIREKQETEDEGEREGIKGEEEGVFVLEGKGLSLDRKEQMWPMDK